MKPRDTLLKWHLPRLQLITIPTAGMEVGLTTGSQTSHQEGQSLRLVCLWLRELQYGMKTTVFQNMNLCSLVEGCRRFGGKDCLHLQDQRVNQAGSNQIEGLIYGPGIHQFLSTCCLLGLLFDLEDGRSTPLRNIGKLLSDYMAKHSRTLYSSESLS
jgi:hypothetical protein